MKSSYYNFFFPFELDQTKRIAYNSLSGALALMDEESYRKYDEFSNNEKSISDEKLVDELKKGFFLIDDHVNELHVIRHNMLANRFSTSSFGMTISPTSDCNFRCVYCYEKDVISKVYMTEVIQRKIVEILENQIKTISTFSVTWYGGEPLLAMDTISNLSHEFIKHCSENDVDYHAGVITNGYYLTRNNLERLNKLNINMIQITLDGMPETHDKRRPLANGAGSFDTIINNLIDNYDLLPRVALRINIDIDNLNSGEYIYSILKKNNMLEKIRPYFGQVVNDNKTYDDSTCLNTCDYANAEYDYSLYVSENTDPYVKYPTFRPNYCGADYRNSLVVGADGDLYKCWSDIGYKDRTIGNILGKETTANDIYYKYIMFDPTQDEDCSKCNLLPICMGGCPNRRILNATNECSIYRYILDRCLKDAAKLLKERAKEEKDVCTDCKCECS